MSNNSWVRKALIGCGAALIVVLLMSWWACRTLTAPESNLDDTLAELKSLGFLTSADEANRAYKKGKEDSSETWRSLKAQGLQSLHKAVVAGEWNKVSNLLKEHKEFVDGCDIAIDFESFTPKRDWNLGFYMLFKECAVMKDAAIVFGAKAAMVYRAGNKSEYIEYLSKAIKICHWLASDMPMIPKLVARACVRIVEESLRPIWAQLSNDKTALAQTYALVKTLNALDFRSALNGEVVLARTVIDDLRSGRLSADKFLKHVSADEPPPLLVKALLNKSLLNRVEAKVCKLYLDTIKAWTNRSEVERLYREFSREPGALDFASSYALMITLDTSAFKRSELRYAADCDALVIGVAMLRSKCETGNWPSFKATTAKESRAAIDPDGRELKCRTNGSGLIIYSVGKNGLDDGGVGATGESASEDDRILFSGNLSVQQPANQ